MQVAIPGVQQVGYQFIRVQMLKYEWSAFIGIKIFTYKAVNVIEPISFLACCGSLALQRFWH